MRGGRILKRGEQHDHGDREEDPSGVEMTVVLLPSKMNEEPQHGNHSDDQRGQRGHSSKRPRVGGEPGVWDETKGELPLLIHAEQLGESDGCGHLCAEDHHRTSEAGGDKIGEEVLLHRLVHRSRNNLGNANAGDGSRRSGDAHPGPTHAVSARDRCADNRGWRLVKRLKRLIPNRRQRQRLRQGVDSRDAGRRHRVCICRPQPVVGCVALALPAHRHACEVGPDLSKLEPIGTTLTGNGSSSPRSLTATGKIGVKSVTALSSAPCRSESSASSDRCGNPERGRRPLGRCR